jgi:hypothetical protein
MILGMTLQEIKNAVESGKTVHWATKAYTVLKNQLRDGTHQWLIAYNHGQRDANYIGLTWRDGVTVNGRPEQFFIAE